MAASFARDNICKDGTDIVNEPIPGERRGRGCRFIRGPKHLTGGYRRSQRAHPGLGEIYAETKTFLFALGLCQTAQLFANRHNQLFILHILLPSSNQDIQMIIQEVSSAQKLFPIVRQNQISSVVKFINQWRHVSAIRVQMCNHFLQHNFSPRKTSQRIQQL